MLQSNIGCGISDLEDAMSEREDQKADTLQRAKLMTFKARFYEHFDMPQKALSIAMRAASLAYTNRIIPGLWEAVHVIAHALLSLSEFAASSKLLESILPRVMESEDCDLTGACMASIADAFMGIASRSTGETSWGVKKKMVRALEFLDGAESEFAAVGNVRRQREVLAKRGIILIRLGDQALATNSAAKYHNVGEDLDRGALP